MLIIEILAALSASAAAGIRIALPLLTIGLLQGDNLWSQVPLLNYIYPPVLLSILISWSLIELLASKKLLGQRVLQIIQLALSPIAGAIMGLSVADPTTPRWLIALIGGLLALVLQLVQLGWFYRLRGLPTWVVFLQDILSITLVYLALEIPLLGGLIALTLLTLAVHSSKQWQRWYRQPPNT